MEEISQHSVLLALVCIQLLSMKEPIPRYMSDIQEKINVFTVNLHPLIMLLSIIKGSSDTTVCAVRPASKSLCLLVRVGFISACSTCAQSAHYMLFVCVCGWGGDRGGGYHS